MGNATDGQVPEHTVLNGFLFFIEMSGSVLTFQALVIILVADMGTSPTAVFTDNFA